MKMLSKKEEKLRKKEFKRKTLTCQLIPKCVQRSPLVFYLKGSIFIDLNSNYQQRISNINHFKQISYSTILRNLGIIYQDFYNNISEFDSCAATMAILKQYNNKDILELASKLEDYEEALNNNDSIKSSMKQIVSSNTQVRIFVDQKRNEFYQARREKLLSMPKTSYIMFFDFAFDYTNSSLQMTGSGINEAFAKFLGCNLDTITNISMRRGILEIMDETSKWKLLTKGIEFAKYNYSQITAFKQQIILRTLDEISVDSDFSIEALLCQSVQAFSGYFHPDYIKYTFDRGTIFCEVTVSDSQINMINGIRKKYTEGELNYFNRGYYPYLLSPIQGSRLDQGTEEMQGEQTEQRKCLSLDQARDTCSSEQKHNKLSKCHNQSETEMQLTPISNIISSRENPIVPCQPQILENLIFDIPYIIQSQYFLEKFYGIKQNQQALNEDDNNSNESILRKCGIRKILHNEVNQ